MPTIRPFDYSDGDYEAYVSIVNAVRPDMPASVVFEKRHDSLRVPEHLNQRLLVDLDEGTSATARPVAVGDYGHMPWSFHPHRFYLSIVVHPDYQGHGIGSALYEHIVARLRPHQPISLDATAREDSAQGRRFLEKRGFTLGSRVSSSRLNPADFDPGQFAGAVERVRKRGIVLLTLAELVASDPDYLHKLYDLECEAAQDVPWHDQMTMQPFEQYAMGYRDNPDLMPDGYQVAMDGDQVVGLTQLWRTQATDTILYTGFTGVRRTHRRQGIATALKANAIAYAKTLITSSGGPPVIRTDNEETNPMFQLNLRLGFREMPAWLNYRRELGPEETL